MAFCGAGSTDGIRSGRRSCLSLSRSHRRAEARQHRSRSARPSAKGGSLETCVRNHTHGYQAGPPSRQWAWFFSNREGVTSADLFTCPTSGVPILFADPKRYAPDYASMSSRQLEDLARASDVRRTMAGDHAPQSRAETMAASRRSADAGALGEEPTDGKTRLWASLASSLPAAELVLIQGAPDTTRIEQPTMP